MIDITKIINKTEIETPAHIIDLNELYNNKNEMNFDKFKTHFIF